MEKPSPKSLCEAIPDISSAYASMILSDDPDKNRKPARSLAILIFRQTNWKHPSIADLTDEQMKVFEEVDPWTPREKAA